MNTYIYAAPVRAKRRPQIQVLIVSGDDMDQRRYVATGYRGKRALTYALWKARRYWPAARHYEAHFVRAT